MADDSKLIIVVVLVVLLMVIGFAVFMYLKSRVVQPTGPAPLGSIWCYDDTTNQWSSLPNISGIIQLVQVQKGGYACLDSTGNVFVTNDSLKVYSSPSWKQTPSRSIKKLVQLANNAGWGAILNDGTFSSTPESFSTTSPTRWIKNSFTTGVKSFVQVNPTYFTYVGTDKNIYYSQNASVLTTLNPDWKALDVKDAVDISVFRDSTFEYLNTSGNVFVTQTTDLANYSQWKIIPTAVEAKKFVQFLNGTSGYINKSGKVFSTETVGTGTNPKLFFDKIDFPGITNPVLDVCPLTNTNLAVVA